MKHARKWWVCRENFQKNPNLLSRGMPQFASSDFWYEAPFSEEFHLLSPLNFIDTNLIKADFQVLLFHRSRRGFPSLLRYGQRRRVTDTVILVFFSLVSISKYMLFLVYVWTGRPHRGAFAAFPKKWQMPDKCHPPPPLRMTYAWNCDWPIKYK